MIKSGGVIYHNWLLPSSAKGFSQCSDLSVTSQITVTSQISVNGCHYLQILLEFFEPALDGMDFLELKRAKSNAGTTVSRRERVQESVSKHVMLYS